MVVIPLGDASRRPIRFPVITASIIVLYALVSPTSLPGITGSRF